MQKLLLKLTTRSELLLDKINSLSEKLIKLDNDLYSESRILYFTLKGLTEDVTAIEGELKALITERDSIQQQNINIAKQLTTSELGYQSIEQSLKAKTNELTSVEKVVQTLNGQLEAVRADKAQKAIEHKKQITTVRTDCETRIEQAKEKSKKSSEKAQTKLQARIDKLEENEAHLRSELAVVEDENKKLRAMLRATNGAQLSNMDFQGKTQGVSFSIVEFNTPLEVKYNDIGGLKLLNEAPYHYQVRRSNGVAINVGQTTWLTAVLPLCADFQDEWNPEISDRLHELLLGKAKTSFPREYKIVQAAKKHPITNHSLLTKSQSDALKKSKLINLFDSISLTRTAFETKLSASNKKMTQEECLALRFVVEKIADQFVDDYDAGKPLAA